MTFPTPKRVDEYATARGSQPCDHGPEDPCSICRMYRVARDSERVHVLARHFTMQLVHGMVSDAGIDTDQIAIQFMKAWSMGYAACLDIQEGDVLSTLYGEDAKL